MVAAECTPKDKLVAYALELGFDSCRIASARTPRHAKEFRSWLGDGAAGEMQGMERGAEKRCDPERGLPGLRSVIVVAFNYWPRRRLQTKERRVLKPPTESGLGKPRP